MNAHELYLDHHFEREVLPIAKNRGSISTHLLTLMTSASRKMLMITARYMNSSKKGAYSLYTMVMRSYKDQVFEIEQVYLIVIYISHSLRNHIILLENKTY